MIEADQERTFQMFARRLAAWWPVETLSSTPGKASDVRVEEWAGGRIYEIRHGGEHNWGQVTSWNPPKSFSFTWKIIPGREFTEVDVLFQKLAPALTRVVIVHHGWESLSTALFDRYAKYAGGWALALRRFAAMFEDDLPAAGSVSDDSEQRN